MDLSRLTTKDVLAVMVVSATLVFAGISMVTGRPLDATTIGFSGIIIGHYFRGTPEAVSAPEQPLGEPALGGEGD